MDPTWPLRNHNGTRRGSPVTPGRAADMAGDKRGVAPNPTAVGITRAAESLHVVADR